MNFDWTDERVAHLRRRVAEGARYRAVAGELGCTRNAVIGKLSRLGALRPRPPSAAKPEAPAADSRVLQFDGVLEIFDEPPPAAGVRIWELRCDQCRWLLRCGAPWVHCGAAVASGSYCAEHAARAYANRED